MSAKHDRVKKNRAKVQLREKDCSSTLVLIALTIICRVKPQDGCLISVRDPEAGPEGVLKFCANLICGLYTGVKAGVSF
jgi:hypothetical protein